MTEPTNNVKKGKDERPVQYLGDPGVIYSLCFSCVEEQAGIMEQLISGEMDAKEAAQAHTDMAGKLAAILCGRLPEFFAPAEGWNGDAIGCYLKGVFEAEIRTMDEENRELFLSEPSAAVFYAALKMQREITALLSDEHGKSDDDAEAGGRRVHDLCVKWTELFSVHPKTKDAAR